MAAIAERRPAPRLTEHDAFLAMTGFIWLGVLAGFGTDIATHLSRSYPPIVHVHALAMVSWLGLFTAQVLLVRTGRTALHRRLGLIAPWLAAAMLVLGPATAIFMDRLAFETKHAPPDFLAVQLSDMLAFATMTAAALLLRKDKAAHKRLMLLGTLYISDAGFARWIGDAMEGAVTTFAGDGYWAFFASAYTANVALVLVFGALDFAVNRRLHPAYLAGAAWTFAIMLGASGLFFNPAWHTAAMWLIGH
jgi:uncharacterized membrane protein